MRRKEGDTDETHIVSGGRVLLSVTFFIMLSLGFMYQQSSSIIQSNLEARIGHLSSGLQREWAENPEQDLAVEIPDKTAQIANAIIACRTGLDTRDVSSFANAVRRESEKYGYDWELILAIIKTESSVNTRARSHKGAMGLMQVMPSTAEWLSPKLGIEYRGHSSLYDPVYNVKLGTHYLHMLHQKFGDIQKAIAAYNRGPTGLSRYLRQGRKYPSSYLAKVMDCYKQLKNNADECAS